MLTRSRQGGVSMPQPSDFGPARRRFVTGMAGTVAALALPAWVFAQATAEAKKKYPAKVVDLVDRSLVIDMLGPLKLDFTPNAYSGALSPAEVAMWRTCGITA